LEWHLIVDQWVLWQSRDLLSSALGSFRQLGFGLGDEVIENPRDRVDPSGLGLGRLVRFGLNGELELQQSRSCVALSLSFDTQVEEFGDDGFENVERRVSESFPTSCQVERLRFVSLLRSWYLLLEYFDEVFKSLVLGTESKKLVGTLHTVSPCPRPCTITLTASRLALSAFSGLA
jgi:hypothetical protein